MLNKKEIITSLALVLLLLGCDSNTQQLSNVSDMEQRVSETETIVEETYPSDWYIRLVAEDPVRELKSSATQLGELDEDDAVTKHTLTAFTPFGSGYLDIIFRDPDGVASGDYKVNFHNYEVVSALFSLFSSIIFLAFSLSLSLTTTFSINSSYSNCGASSAILFTISSIFGNAMAKTNSDSLSSSM